MYFNGYGVFVNAFCSIGRKIETVNKQITAYGYYEVFSNIVRAYEEGRLLSFDKKRSQTLSAGKPGSDSPVTMQDVDFEKNYSKLLGKSQMEARREANYRNKKQYRR